MQLVWFMGSFYIVVALLVVSIGIFGSCRQVRPGKTGPQQQSGPSEIEAHTITPEQLAQSTAISSDGVRLVQTGTPVFRSVKRQNSAWLTGSKGNSKDLTAIETSIKMGFILADASACYARSACSYLG